MSEIDYVEMTVILNNGPPVVSKITEAAACSIHNNVFMRPGEVSMQNIKNGYLIADGNGRTTLVAVFK